MGEYNAMCEKILFKIEHILISEPDVQEFAIVPTAENEKNRSPIIYEQNCLGLESWCKKYLLQYTHTYLLKHRRALLRNQLTIEKMKKLNHALIGALLIQPNVTTFWNMKRELLKAEVLNMEQELIFSKIILSFYAKCNEVFIYRKWLIDNILFKENNLEILGNELNICELTAEKSANNYHAWNHRIWCMKKIMEIHSDFDTVILSELNFSLNWISKHISENAGYYYRQTLIQNLSILKNISCTLVQNFDFNIIGRYLKLPHFSDDTIYILHYLLGKSNILPIPEDCPKYVNMLFILLNDLLVVSTELNFLYRDHECLWNYRRFLIIHAMKLLFEYHSISFNFQLLISNLNVNCDINILQLDINSLTGSKCEISKKLTSSILYKSLIKNELEFVECNRSTSNIVQNSLALRHLKWLKCTNFFMNDKF